MLRTEIGLIPDNVEPIVGSLRQQFVHGIPLVEGLIEVIRTGKGIHELRQASIPALDYAGIGISHLLSSDIP